jgi:transglutaminase-like putative cysteine protease
MNGGHVMKITMRLLATAIALTSLSLAQLPAQEQQISPDGASDLRGRHPNLFRYKEFTEWLKPRKIGPWHESRDPQGVRMVVVQDLQGEAAFAAQMAPRTDEVQRSQPFNLRELKQTRSDVTAAATKANFNPATIFRIRPNVSYSNDRWNLQWSVEVRTDGAIDSYVFTDGLLNRAQSRKLGQQAMALGAGRAGFRLAKFTVASTFDDLASNELHHVSAFAAEVTEWIGTITTPVITTQAKAHAVYHLVSSRYEYDENIQDIKEFVWADELTRTNNIRNGVCDEWAVVAASYLRAVGIPARIKVFIWDDGGMKAGHAAVEYNDGGVWRHMDPLFGAFNDETVYRARGFTNVTVIDADFPDDSRSSIPVRGKPDKLNDGKLNLLADFKIAPSRNGNPRPGYSF